MKIATRMVVAVALAAGSAAPVAEAGTSGRMYQVTVTNLTRGQVITPPVVILHNADYSLFSAGQPASAGLVALAEDGVSADLVAALEIDGNVGSFVAGDTPIMPAGSLTFEVETSGLYRFVTVVGMLASTNDGFFAISSVELPIHSATVDAVVYDAGSEANNESCDTIPGPPCGNPLVRDTAGAEGFVHVHNGIHGFADLVPADLDWRNPAARIFVERN